MKKLNLQLGSIKEMLTKEQMKRISGGYSTTCKFHCCTDSHTNCTGYTSSSITCSGAEDCAGHNVICSPGGPQHVFWLCN